MVISLDRIGKRFRSQWIFRHVTLELRSGDSLAILGPNGTGKSTFLQIMGGLLQPTEGQIRISGDQSSEMAGEDVIRQVSLSGPYLELPEELSLRELLGHHFRFRAIHPMLTLSELPSLWQLAQAADRPIKQYSSGMKQRVKLGLAICSSSPILLLDEPLTNLDDQGRDWYYELIKNYGQGRIQAIASNRTDETVFCGQFLHVQDYA